MRAMVPLLAAMLLTACGGADGNATAEAPPLRFEMAAGAGAEAQLAHGERMARVLGCMGCHGDGLTGEQWIDLPEIAILYTSNLTRALPGYSDAQLEHALREGTRPDGSDLWEMPSHLFTQLSDADMGALIAWLRTVPPAGEAHPRMVLGPAGRQLIETGEVKPAAQHVREERDREPPALDGSHGWARYMVRATCAECHGMDLEGEPSPEPGASVRPDLIIAGAYSRDAFRQLLRTGAATGGRQLALMAEVARGRYAHLTDREIDAIHAYLVARAAQPQ